MSTTDFTIAPHHLTVLGSCFPAVTSLSPLAGDVVRPDGRSDLTASGILLDSGAPTPANKDAVEVLAGCIATARVTLATGRGLFDYATYFDRTERGPAAITRSADGARVRMPAPTDDALAWLGEVFGSTTITGARFETELDQGAAIVLGALIDETRKAMLRAVADDEPFVPAPVGAQQIATTVGAQKAGPFWVTSALTDLVGRDGLSEAPASLAGLIDKGLATQQDGGYVASETVLDLAARLLVIEQAIAVFVAHSDPAGGDTGGGFVGLRSGGHDLLMLEAVGDRVKLHTMAPGEVLELTARLLNDPRSSHSR